ncbi:Ionotropic receptor 148 [Hyalella azteca]|uniref:Ionotropic receptor 148 n=1 Tax=Hyalella azteca TaxID=294128 RepID=A0A6A0GUI1_HYAAZ|nr:Ionotropic receptor 148 [Hyalella azteca]
MQACYRVVFLNYPVLNNAAQGDPPKLGGAFVDVFRLIAKELDICYTPVLPTQNLYGNKLPNGTWNGMLGMLEREEADMSASGLFGDFERVKNFAFSEYVFMDYTSIAYKEPVVEPNMAGFLLPFTLKAIVIYKI